MQPMSARPAVLGLAAVAAMATPVTPTFVLAAEAPSCATVRMSDPGWTDITSTNAIAANLLEPLGYEQEMQQVAVPVTYQAIRTNKIDVFLGNWMPAQSALVEPLKASGDLAVLNANLEGVRFTLAVPGYVGEAGVTSVADLAKNADKFDRTIYGIEAGAPANQHIAKMIETNDFGLGEWKLVESSEQAMLAQVQRAGRRKDWVAFLAWEPHPMNSMLPITYLAGADSYFGPNYGSTTIYTVSRKGFAKDCPNLAKLFGQLDFTVETENMIMGAIAEGKDPKAVAADRIKAEPAVLETWLAGVTTVKGEPALPAVRKALALD